MKQPAYKPNEAGIVAEAFKLDEEGRLNDVAQLRDLLHVMSKLARQVLDTAAPMLVIVDPELAMVVDQASYIAHALTCPSTGGYGHPIFSEDEIAKVAEERAGAPQRGELEQWLPFGSEVVGVTKLDD